MADELQSTDRLSEDTRPESPRLLAEGAARIEVADFSAITGGYQGSVNVDISDINEIGNNTKDAFASYKVEVWQGYEVINKYHIFRPLPYVSFTDHSTGSVGRVATFSVSNDGTAGGGIFISYLNITYFANSNAGANGDDAGDDQLFFYKIWSVPFIG